MILSIDIGTSSSRAIVFSRDGSPLVIKQRQVCQVYPEQNWVEQNAKEIVSDTLSVTKEAIKEAESKGIDVKAIGISNQRESIIVWDKHTAEPIYNAIIWQDSRTADLCQKYISQGFETEVREKTGLFIDPYFSATKIKWILDNVTGARSRAEKGDLLFGTVDSYFIFCITQGNRHCTDATNASRTSLYNINTSNWDEELFKMFDIPMSMAPMVLNSADDFGVTSQDLLDKKIDICGVAGDQQASTFGQTCFDEGDIKATFGTGCFALLNIGNVNRLSSSKLLNTIAYRINGVNTYALEGAVFSAGTVVHWLKNNMGLIQTAEQSEAMASSVSSNGGVYFVPAFNGLGAPHWRPTIKGAIFGLTQSTSQAEIVRAGLESVVYQVNDLIHAMRKDYENVKTIRVDGGMVANNWMMQFLANITDINIDRSKVQETSALGAALLAGLQKGFYGNVSEIREIRNVDKTYVPSIESSEREFYMKNWNDALKCLL